MITNTRQRSFDVVEVTNEMPLNRTGGVGTVIENLMSGLAGQDLEVLWYLMDHGYLPWQVDEILRRFPNVAVGSSAELGAFETGVFHLHSYAENAGLEAHLANRVCVCTIHSLLAMEARSNDVDLSAAVAWQESLIQRSTAVVLVSRAELHRYRELGYHRLNPRVRVIHNGLRPPSRYRAPRGRRTFGYCGRLVPRKHPEYAQIVLQEPGFEECRTLIAGRGFSVYARTLMRDRRLHDRVDYLGWCAGERLEAFFDAIDVLAVPSIYEPFGLVAVEATARGIPVIATRVDGLEEVLGEHAFYCSDTSYPAFRDAAYAWAGATLEELGTMGDAARERYEQLFSDRVMGRRYRALFTELLA